MAKVEVWTGDGFRVGATTFTLGSYVKMDAERTNEAGGSGNWQQVQISAKYGF